MTDRPVRVAGVELTCKHCGRNRFHSRRALLNTTMLTLFDLDWLNRSATVFVCVACGYAHWFLEPPEEVELPPERPGEDDRSDASSCMQCGETIPAGRSRCDHCGWTYA